METKGRVWHRLGQGAGWLSLLMPLMVSLTGIATCDNPDDLDGDGVTSAEGDCDDSNDTIYPTAPERCDARDNDCDGSVDEGVNCLGTIATVAGTGVAGYAGDGGPATQAQLTSPVGLAIAPDGTYYFADTMTCVVRRVGPDGVISTFAGTGIKGYSGDGGPATAAELGYPNGVALDGLGRLLIGEFANAAVRRVDTNGIIQTVAGTGVRGYAGDGGPATRAQLSYPNFLAVMPDNSFYISDAYTYRIRYVGTDGIIRTVVGDGNYGYDGDNQPATEASLGLTTGLALDAAGALYVADVYTQRIRRVSNGTIYASVALGYKGYYGDGGPATEALVNTPMGSASIVMATCSSPIDTTTGCASSPPTASSIRWWATVRQAIRGMEALPALLSSTSPWMWPSTPQETSSSRNTAIMWSDGCD